MYVRLREVERKVEGERWRKREESKSKREEFRMRKSEK